MKQTYLIETIGQKITVSWGKVKVWHMPYTIDNWNLTSDFIKEFQKLGYTIILKTA